MLIDYNDLMVALCMIINYLGSKYVMCIKHYSNYYCNIKMRESIMEDQDELLISSL